MSNRLAIVADDYKVPRFEIVLKEKGYKYELKKNTIGALKGTKTLTVLTSISNRVDIQKICQGVELHFKRRR